MSASTVSITANPSSVATRRRTAVEKRQPAALDIAESNLAAAAAAAAVASPSTGNDKHAAGDAAIKDLSQHSIRTETRDPIQAVRKPLPNSNGASPSSRRAGTTKKSSKPEKPRWLTVVSIFTKNFCLLLIIVGLIQMVRRIFVDSGSRNTDGLTVISDDFEGKVAELENFLKKTTKMMQVQVDVIDKKIESEIKTVRNEFSEKLEEKGAELDAKFKELDGRSENLKKLVIEMETKNWVSKEEFDKFVDEFKEKKGVEISDVSLDEVRAYARDIVEREIEKHAADGLGRVDFALASGGAMVVKHSEPFVAKGGSSTWISLTNRYRVHSDAPKMLTPSFGEPGQCFALKGNNGFVQIRLRTAIIPEAVTLEHVAKSVAYDRSSAPKDCRVSGWLQRQDMTDAAVDGEKMFLLTEFTYDLEKTSAQTFNVLESAASSVVDTIRLDFGSNHGNPLHTCIYRLRVHGSEPNSVSMMPMES
nr:protein SAD1/UNC-84 domain protein 1-like [Ipomoea batatas]